MSNANERQEGGDHYKQDNKPQHWDLAVMYSWDPFQYQITKYVMRWKDKHPTHAQRLVDLKKARHFLDKYIEVAEHYDPRYASETFPPVDIPLPDVVFPNLEAIADMRGPMTPSTLAQQVSALGRLPVLDQPLETGEGEALDPVQFINEVHGAQASTLEWQNEGYYGDGTCLWKCMSCGGRVRAPTSAAAHAIGGGSCPHRQPRPEGV